MKNCTLIFIIQPLALLMLSALSIFDSKLDSIFRSIDDSVYHYSWSFILGYVGVFLLLLGAAVFGGSGLLKNYQYHSHTQGKAKYYVLV